ncbi:MAG: CheY-like chemotaxis protein [Chlamydiales bacterium]
MLSYLPFTRISDSWRARVVTLLVALVLGVCTFHHLRAPDPVQLARLDSSVARIQELEREILSDVSFMRVGDRRSTRIRDHLDELGQMALELKVTIQRDYPAAVTGIAERFASLYARVEAQERSVSSLMLHLEFMLERLYRIPETITALERATPYIWADPELTSVVSSILRDLFVSAARNDASAELWFEQDLERLRALRDDASTDLAPVIERLATYCEALTQRARFVDTGLRDLEALPVSRAVSELREDCLFDFVERQKQATVWRWTLGLLLGVAIVALSFRILVLGKSSQLDQSESELLRAQLSGRDDLVEELELRLADERQRAERAEASYRRSRLQEQSALRTKQEFFGFLEHHVRGRVRKLLAEAGEGDAPDGSRLAVSRHAQLLHDMLSDLFDMQQIQADELQLERSDCGLDLILDRVEEHGRTLARTKAISLSVHRSEGTPATIYSDPERLRRVLQNLLEHAILSTDTGEVEMSIDLLVDAGHSLQFTVRDSGRGMNSDRIDFLFTPPQDGERIEGRAEALATPGLAVVPGLVKALGGSFRVDSIVGRGTTIILEIEISEPVVGSASVGERLAEGTGVALAETGFVPTRVRPDLGLAQPLSGRRILVAEDGADNRRLMDFLLKRAGATVDMAVNGEMAYEDVMAAEEQSVPYDLVLMDMNMPVMDGYDATESLRADGYTRPIVALTASALPENRDRCLEAGCDEFMTKPVDAKVFAHQLEDIAMSRVGPSAEPSAEPRPDAAVSVPADLLDVAVAEESEIAPVSEPEPLLLSAYADDDDMTELIELFVRDLRSDIQRINVALTEGDLESLGMLAHQLKGSAGSYGFPQLTVQADRLESCVRTGVDPERLEQEVREFVELCKRISG